MTLHLAEIAPGKHAVLLLDQAGWRLSLCRVVPATITLLMLPAKCPELNPVENVWQLMRDNYLSNRVVNATSISSTIAARHRNASSIRPVRSCPSACAIGPTCSDQRDFV
jgi:transposase